VAKRRASPASLAPRGKRASTGAGPASSASVAATVRRATRRPSRGAASAARRRLDLTDADTDVDTFDSTGSDVDADEHDPAAVTRISDLQAQVERMTASQAEAAARQAALEAKLDLILARMSGPSSSSSSSSSSSPSSSLLPVSVVPSSLGLPASTDDALRRALSTVQDQVKDAHTHTPHTHEGDTDATPTPAASLSAAVLAIADPRMLYDAAAQREAITPAQAITDTFRAALGDAAAQAAIAARSNRMSTRAQVFEAFEASLRNAVVRHGYDSAIARLWRAYMDIARWRIDTLDGGYAGPFIAWHHANMKSVADGLVTFEAVVQSAILDRNRLETRRLATASPSSSASTPPTSARSARRRGPRRSGRSATHSASTSNSTAGPSVAPATPSPQSSSPSVCPVHPTATHTAAECRTLAARRGIKTERPTTPGEPT
jgi:hypothetical protein